jgi:hypothetical protein
MEFLKLMRRMENIGHCQIIMATHSPMLMAYPDARLLRLTKYGLEPVTVKDTDHYKVMREFCDDPAGFVEARSQLGDWALIPRGYAFPEPVQEADAIIIVGGWDGTHHAASWGRIARKPVLPVATFGGAAADIYGDEIAAFDGRSVANIPREDFEALNRVLSDETEAAIDQYAIEMVKLAERTILSSDVFVVMSFEDKPHLRDAYNTFRRVCAEKNFNAVKVDHHLDNRERIVPAIFSNIKRAAFVIAEISGARPNV